MLSGSPDTEMLSGLSQEHLNVASIFKSLVDAEVAGAFQGVGWVIIIPLKMSALVDVAAKPA